MPPHARESALLANKEALVMSGELFMEAVRRGGATLLPIDSEHNAIFQALPLNYAGDPSGAGVSRILLTASGGPFRTLERSALAHVTPGAGLQSSQLGDGSQDFGGLGNDDEQGPRGDRGLLALRRRPELIQVVVHPQSVIHSMVQYVTAR